MIAGGGEWAGKGKGGGGRGCREAGCCINRVHSIVKSCDSPSFHVNDQKSRKKGALREKGGDWV